MITDTQFQAYRAWFDGYVARFKEAAPDDLAKIELKEHHTRRVLDEIRALCESENVSGDDARLAETAALLHDVGRLEQYVEHRGVVDMHSEDHGRLGIEVLKRENVLADLDEETRDLIFRVISYHNKAKPPEDETARCLLLTRLLRDADKLDILGLMIRDYENPEDEVAELITLGLPDSPEVSPEVIADLDAGSIVLAEHLKTFTDFRLLLMGWVHDIHFTRTFEQFAERRYLERITAHMPDTPQVRAACEKLKAHVRKRIGEA
jgi:putative nucleotidyltransferase with HDIG domain